MPARILSPFEGDNVTATMGGTVTVTSMYKYHGSAQLQSFVGGDSHPAASVFGADRFDGEVPILGLMVGLHNVAVSVESDGVQDDIQQNVNVDVTGVPYVLTARRTAPAPPAPLPPPGIPVEFIILGTALANTAYLAVAAYSVPFVGHRTVLSGVLATPQADRTWAVGITVPNAPEVGYVARIIQFDATDNVIHKRTVVLI